MNKFLETFKDSYIQLFDDRKYWKEKPSLPEYVSTMPMDDFVKNINNVKKLNELGVGVFFTPNPCKGGRKESNVTEINWVYVDMDSGSKKDQMQRIKESPFYPNIIIESLRSYHCYWRCDIRPDDFKNLINGIILFYNGDQAITSSNEVLRVPGFLHKKYKDNSFLIKTLKFDLEKISYEDMAEAYPKPIDLWQKKYGMSTDDLTVLKDVPIKLVLDRLGIQYSNKNEILENGEITSAVINDKQNYVNRFSGKPPSGSTIDIAMHYNNTDVKGAIEWLRDTFLIKKEKKKLETTGRKDVTLSSIMEELSRERKLFTWGTELLDNSITAIEPHHFCILAGLAGAGKTAFAFDIAWKNSKLGYKILFLSLEMSEDALLVRGARSFAGITKSEWKNRPVGISSYKLELYEKRAKDLVENKNILLRSFPSNVDPTTENVFAMIESIGPDLTIIDNLDLIKKDPKQSEYLEQNRIAKELMDLCHQKKEPIIMLHHENPHSKGKGLSAMRGSAKLGDSCDTQLSCLREWTEGAEAKTNAEFTVMVNKDRDFGQWTMSKVYFKNGVFVDEYDDVEFEPWENNI